MPTLISRGCSPELATRVKRYARLHPTRSTSESIAELIRVGLDTLEARAAGGRARHADLTAAQRSEMMRHLALQRHRILTGVDTS